MRHDLKELSRLCDIASRTSIVSTDPTRLNGYVNGQDGAVKFGLDGGGPWVRVHGSPRLNTDDARELVAELLAGIGAAEHMEWAAERGLTTPKPNNHPDP